MVHSSKLYTRNSDLVPDPHDLAGWQLMKAELERLRTLSPGEIPIHCLIAFRMNRSPIRSKKYARLFDDLGFSMDELEEGLRWGRSSNKYRFCSVVKWNVHAAETSGQYRLIKTMLEDRISTKMIAWIYGETFQRVHGYIERSGLRHVPGMLLLTELGGMYGMNAGPLATYLRRRGLNPVFRGRYAFYHPDAVAAIMEKRRVLVSARDYPHWWTMTQLSEALGVSASRMSDPEFQALLNEHTRSVYTTVHSSRRFEPESARAFVAMRRAGQLVSVPPLALPVDLAADLLGISKHRVREWSMIPGFPKVHVHRSTARAERSTWNIRLEGKPLLLIQMDLLADFLDTRRKISTADKENARSKTDTWIQSLNPQQIAS